MKVYEFNENTGEFLFSRNAQLDPLESKKADKKVYVSEGKRFTSIKPPTKNTNHVCCFINGEWEQVEDNRDKVFHIPGNEQNMKMVKLGPLPEGAIEGERPETAEEIIERKKRVIQVKKKLLMNLLPNYQNDPTYIPYLLNKKIDGLASTEELQLLSNIFTIYEASINITIDMSTDLDPDNYDVENNPLCHKELL